MLIVAFCLVSLFIVICTIDYDDNTQILKVVFFSITTILCFVVILDESFKLRDKDVFVGKAEYVETIHISKGDTIKTYHIQPKK